MSCSEWKEYKLEDLIINYNSKRKPLSSRERENRKGIYPYYGAQGIIDYLDDYIFDGEYLLIAEDGNNLKERNEDIARIAKGKFWVNNHAHIITNNELSDMRFLKYYINTLDISAYITGSAQPKLNKANLSNIKIKAPSLEEQKKIADILSSLDDKIELNNEMNKTLEEMAQSIFKRWFVDFEFPNVDGQPYKSSGGEMVESELGMIPKGWEVKTIGDLCEVGSSKRIFMREYVESGIPFFRSKEIIEKSKGENISTELFITKERYKEIKEKFGVPSKNDILLTSVGTLGIPYLVDDEEFYFKDGNLTWFKNFNEEVFRYYIYQWLLSSEGKKSIDEVTIGSTQKALTINSLKSMRVVIPSKNILNKYQGFISSNIANIRENNIQKLTLINLKDSLLPKLMSGKLKLQI